MFVLAITGGLGAGKSTAADLLVARGAALCSLDEVAHDVLSPGSEALARIAVEFGDCVIASDGSLDRAALAEIAFTCHESAARLNAIVHPLVVSRTRQVLTDALAGPNPPAALVLEIPLLAEAPELVEIADEVLAISAPEELRLARAVARGMDEADARHRIICQATDEEREALATHVIVNDDGPEQFAAAVAAFWDAVSRGDSGSVRLSRAGQEPER